MSPPPENPYRSPGIEGVVRRGDRAMWIEHRLREAYVGICAAIVGGFLYGRLPHLSASRLPFPDDLLVLLCCTVLPAAVSVLAMHMWRSQRSPDSATPGFDAGRSAAMDQ